MQLLCDCHIHTISSGHAYSSVTECARAAFIKGLSLIAITDHAPSLPGGPHIFHFHNLRVLPPVLEGVRLLRGVEVNILDGDGLLDLDDHMLSVLDLVIASLHLPCYQAGGRKENTRAVISAMQSRHVDILGHPDDGRVPLDLDEIARAAAATGTMLEINNSSLMPISFREKAEENYALLLESAIRYNARLVVNSDAHFHEDVGNFTKAVPLLVRHGIPESMVANTTPERILSWLKS